MLTQPYVNKGSSVCVYINLKRLKHCKFKLDTWYIEHSRVINYSLYFPTTKNNNIYNTKVWLSQSNVEFLLGTNRFGFWVLEFCFWNFQTVCSALSRMQSACIYVHMHVGSDILKSTPTRVCRGWTRPGRESTKTTISPSAWTCRLCGLVSPRLQPTPLFLLLLHLLSYFPNFLYSHWSISLNGCQSFGPAVCLKQSLLQTKPQHKTVTDVTMWPGTVQLPWRQTTVLTWD